MRKLLTALLMATMAMPAMAQTNPLVEDAKLSVADMIQVTSRPIAILERVDNDPGEFWYKAMQALCDATGDNWCEDDVRFLSDTTNQLGWARVFTYVNDLGQTKTACALLPPRPGITAGYAATAISGGTAYAFHEVPTDEEMEAWLWYLHIASCQNDVGSEPEQKRAAVYATVMLTLAEGDAQFVGAYAESPSRLFNKMRFPTETRWGTNLGERLLLEDWKKKTAQALIAVGCTATVVESSDLNTDFITRDSSIGSDCTDTGGGFRSGTVKDENLWLWAESGMALSLPTAPHVPLSMFFSRTAGMQYVWRTAGELAGM